MFWDFCSNNTIALYGGHYDGDVDHVDLADSPGKVWLYHPTESIWEVDELLQTETHQLPPSRSQHTIVRMGGYQVPRVKPPAWSPADRSCIVEGFLVFAGNAVSWPQRYSMQLDDLFYYEPASSGRVSRWTMLQPKLDTSVGPILLRRGGHAAAVDAYHIAEVEGKPQREAFSM